MTHAKQSQPDKRVVRGWLKDRARERKPLPDNKTIRRELGMDMIDSERKRKE